MTILTPEQRQAVEAAGDAPVRLEDPDSHREYVLLSAEAYDRLRVMLESDDDLTPTQKSRHMWDVVKDEWTDPRMDAYDDDPKSP